MRLLKKIISVNENHKKLWFLYELIMIIYDIILSIKEGIKLKFRKKIRKAYKESDKKSFTVYIFLRLLVILTLIRQIMLGEWENVFVCLISLILLLAPFFIEKKFKITIPSMLEIIILCFIFSAEILGEINSFYVRVPHFDTLLHTINGFLCAGVGFSLIDLLNENSKKINLTPLYLSLTAFCFSMTIGVLWEFFEYGADQLLGFDMQKDMIVENINSVELDETRTNTVIKYDNIDKTILYDKDGNVIVEINGYLDVGINDTMKDLIVNFIGALIFSIIGYLYVIDRNKYKFVDNFLFTKKLKVIKEDNEREI